MSLRKEVSGLSQSQGIENMNAVIGAKYFTDYSIYPSLSRIDSDLIDVKSIGGWKEENPDNLYQVNDLASTVNSLLSVIKSKGSLYEAQIRMIPPKEKLRELKGKTHMFLR